MQTHMTVVEFTENKKKKALSSRAKSQSQVMNFGAFQQKVHMQFFYAQQRKWICRLLS